MPKLRYNIDIAGGSTTNTLLPTTAGPIISSFSANAGRYAS